jgi:predicted CoA-binding protein
MSTTLVDINDFLAQRRIALVGASRDPKHFSRALFREMCKRGYDMVPVNPAATEIESQRCFARVQDINPAVGAALLMTRSQDTERVVHDCAEAGIRRVWMYRAGGAQGAVNHDAVTFCRANGIVLVEGHCPLMFIPGTGLLHHAHGFLMKIFGGYPPKAQRPAA